MDEIEGMEEGRCLDPLEEAPIRVIPDVALLRMFEVAKDIKLIKSCRIVCKSWNDVGCRYLREHSHVRLYYEDHPESSEKMAEFKALLKSHPDLPSPFQNYRITLTSCTNPVVMSFLFRENVRLVGIKASPREKFNIREFNKLVEKNKNWILRLRIDGNHDFHYPSDEPVVESPLLKLNYVKFNDTCSPFAPCCHAHYIRSILSHSAPRTLRINVASADVMCQIFVYNYRLPPNLTRLTLDFGSFPPLTQDTANRIGALHLTEKLKRLEINCSFLDSDSYLSDKIDLILERVRPSINDLRLDCLSVDDLKWEWPKLTHLRARISDGSFRGFTPRKFPSLTSVSLGLQWMELPYYHPRCVESILSVHSMELEVCLVDVQVGPEVVEGKSMGLFMCLARHFPNVVDVTLNVPILTTRLFTALKKFYPNVKQLRLCWYRLCNKEIFTGYHGLDTYRQLGWSIDEMNRETSLADFEELEHLHIGTLFGLNDDMIKYGLAEIPKLKSLAVSIPGATRELFQQYMSHVEIQID